MTKSKLQIKSKRVVIARKIRTTVIASLQALSHSETLRSVRQSILKRVVIASLQALSHSETLRSVRQSRRQTREITSLRSHYVRAVFSLRLQHYVRAVFSLRLQQ